MKKRITIDFDDVKDKQILDLLESLGRKKKNYLTESILFYEKYKNVDMENIQGVDPAFKTIALNLSMAFSGGVSMNPITSISNIQEPVKTEDKPVIEEVKVEEKVIVTEAKPAKVESLAKFLF